MVLEANAISEELNKKMFFEIALVSPQARGLKDGRTEVCVCVCVCCCMELNHGLLRNQPLGRYKHFIIDILGDSRAEHGLDTLPLPRLTNLDYVWLRDIHEGFVICEMVTFAWPHGKNG